VGAVAGLLAMGKHSDLAGSNHCSGSSCDMTQQSTLDSYHTTATISTVGFIAGGVGVAAGVILLVTQPRGESASPAHPLPGAARSAAIHVVPVVGLGSIGAMGDF
jgi:hypothetical protein